MTWTTWWPRNSKKGMIFLNGDDFFGMAKWSQFWVNQLTVERPVNSFPVFPSTGRIWKAPVLVWTSRNWPAFIDFHRLLPRCVRASCSKCQHEMAKASMLLWTQRSKVQLNPVRHSCFRKLNVSICNIKNWDKPTYRFGCVKKNGYGLW
jgi:hypothetical protein